MADYVWRPLGELLVERGLLDKYDLEIVLKEQKLSGRLLGEILVTKRLVSPIELTAVLAARHGVDIDAPDGAAEGPAASDPGETRPWRPLGRILVEHDLLTESGLQRVLLAQQRTGAPLGEILLERRYVTPAQLARALAEQQGLEIPSEVLDTGRDVEPAERSNDRYEVRSPGREDPLYSGNTYLDAVDFAFEFLHATNPVALEIWRVGEHEEERVWQYTREASDEYRADFAEKQKCFTPLEFLGEPEGAEDRSASAA